MFSRGLKIWYFIIFSFFFLINLIHFQLFMCFFPLRLHLYLWSSELPLAALLKHFYSALARGCAHFLPGLNKVHGKLAHCSPNNELIIVFSPLPPVQLYKGGSLQADLCCSQVLSVCLVILCLSTPRSICSNKYWIWEQNPAWISARSLRIQRALTSDR